MVKTEIKVIPVCGDCARFNVRDVLGRRHDAIREKSRKGAPEISWGRCGDGKDPQRGDTICSQPGKAFMPRPELMRQT